MKYHLELTSSLEGKKRGEHAPGWALKETYAKHAGWGSGMELTVLYSDMQRLSAFPER